MANGFTSHQVEMIERAAARAWPAAETVGVSGWVWRCSGGGSRRANSLLPLGFAGGDVETAISDVEARYRARGLRSYVQVSSLATPAHLDQRLAARGYTYEEPCLLLAKVLARTPLPEGVEVSDTLTADWFDIYAEPLNAVRRAAEPAMLARVPAMRAFFLVRRGGEALASALGVVSPSGVGFVECVATRADRRRTGAARVVMDALESWAFDNGARLAALQVVEGNAAARALYERRGYSEAGRYHYRWKDV